MKSVKVLKLNLSNMPKEGARANLIYFLTQVFLITSSVLIPSQTRVHYLNMALNWRQWTDEEKEKLFECLLHMSLRRLEIVGYEGNTWGSLPPFPLLDIVSTCFRFFSRDADERESGSCNNIEAALTRVLHSRTRLVKWRTPCNVQSRTHTENKFAWLSQISCSSF